MKIIIPNYCLPDTFVDNVSFTLRLMGHDVLTPPIPKTSIFNQKAIHILQNTYDILFPNTHTEQEKWLLKNFKLFKPDIVFTLTQSLNEEVLGELKKSKILTICWWGDTAANMKKQGLLSDGWDFIFIKDRYAAFKLKTLDLNAFYLPEAMNPEWHKKNASKRNNDIVFAGNAYDYRHYLIKKLLKSGVEDIKLFGFRPPRWADESLQKTFTNKFIIKEEKSEVFGNARACINSTAMSEGNSLNCRAFEIAGAAGLQIMEYRSAIEDCFEPQKEILTYSSFDELLERITFAEKFAKESDTIREASYKRAISDHTYQNRLESIIKTINS